MGYFPLVLLLFISVLVAIALGAYSYRYRDVPGARPFAWMMLLSACWVLVAALEVLSPALPDKIVWHKTRVVFVESGWVAIFIFALDFTGHSTWLTRRRFLSLLIIPAIVSAGSLTTDWNGWYRYNLRISPGAVPSIVSEFGPLFYFHYAYLTALLVASVALLLRPLPHAHPLYRRQVLAVLAGMALPLGVDLLDSIGIAPIPGFTLTPVFWAYSGVLFAYALFRFRMFDLTPIARSIIVENMVDLMLVLDAQGRLVDLNPAAGRTLNLDRTKAAGLRLDALPEPWRAALAPYRGVAAARDEISVADRAFEISIAPVGAPTARPSGTLIVLHEVTQRKEFEATLHRLNAELEKKVAARTAELETTLTEFKREFAEHQRAEDALRQSEERHRLLFETMAQGVIYHDDDGKVLAINPAAERLLGLSPEQMRDAPPQDLRGQWVDEYGGELAAEDFPGLVALRTASPIRDCIVGVLRAPGATYRWLDVNAIPLFRAGESRPYRVYSTLQDVTERKQIEEIFAQRVADQSGKLAALYGVILVAAQSLSMQETLEQSLEKILLAVNGQAATVHQVVDGRLCLSAQRGLTSEQQAHVAEWPPDWMAGERNVYVAGHLHDSPAPGTVQVPGFGAYLGAPIRLQNEFAGALSVYWSQSRGFSVEDIAMFRAVAEQLSVIIENVRLRERIARTAVVNERRRLARDLHDSVTQSLHSLVLTADNVRALASQGRLERMERGLLLLSEAARQALKEMRLLLYELRLKGIDQVDVAEQLQVRLDAVERRASIDATLIAQQVEQIPPAWSEDLYAIAMEALNNSLKHARATRVTVTLQGRPRGVILDVSDDGRGFDAAHPPTGGMGLRSMCERAERLGGALTVVSAPGQGTQIRLEVAECA